MFSWVKNTAQSTLAVVAGTAEPIYGTDALHSVAEQEDLNPKYEVNTEEDLKWAAMEATSAETQTFYLQAHSGISGLVQIIYSNVANLHRTVQLNCKIFYPDGRIVWSAQALQNHGFDDKMLSFYADDMAITLSDSGDSYTIKSMADVDVIIDLKIDRVAPAFKIGKDGRTNFGTDPKAPWGCIKHVFWPRNTVEGCIMVKEDKIDFTGNAMYIMALQGMKPHHAASKWNFAYYQGPKYSAVMMEFTTPPSYGEGIVNVGGIAKDAELVVVSAKNESAHPSFKLDEETQWPEPTAVKYIWRGKNSEGKDVEATIESKLGQRVDRVDIMHEVPAILKKLVAGAVGTRPYIYQYSTKMTLKLKIGEELMEEEEGIVYSEATFIS